MSTEHPFLDTSFHIRWSELKPQHIEPDIQQALEAAQQEIDRLAGLPLEDATFQNVIIGLEHATRALSEAWGKVGHLDSVLNSPELREAYNGMLPKVSNFFSHISLNSDLWKRVRYARDNTDTALLSPVEMRLLEETVIDFQEQGADLPNDEKKKVAAINQQLAATTQKFSENVLDATNAWEKIITDAALLSGLPRSALEAAQQDAENKGHGTASEPAYRFTLQAPSYMPVMQYADSEELRKEVWGAFSKVAREGETNNIPLVTEILSLRQQKARLLGKENFAELVLARRMAKSGESALNFVENLHSRVADAFRNDYADLQVFRGPTPLEPWDISYWSEKQRRAQYAFDKEELRPYFPMNKVIYGLFSLAEDLFGIAIKEVESECREEPASENTTPEVWDKDVQFYSVQDKASGRHLGSFYADWYPRESKRGGAWMNYLYTGERGTENQDTPHLGLICGNMTPSVAGRPACLTHNEVETVFHEFGHLLHHICGEVTVPSLNGVNVAWDFVELPSQIMENWCWERESLDRFARHVDTDEPIPDDLFEKMLKARNFQSAAITMRQLSFGKMDLDLHIKYQGDDIEDLDATLDSILDGYTPQLATKSPYIAQRFTHIFGSSVGYAAGYYSYKWAEVLDADAFSKFKEDGILNQQTGLDFRNKILAKGNSEAPEKLFYDFMGRDPDPEALLTRAGLV